jgi:hypothetical protein
MATALSCSDVRLRVALRRAPSDCVSCSSSSRATATSSCCASGLVVAAAKQFSPAENAGALACRSGCRTSRRRCRGPHSTRPGLQRQLPGQPMRARSRSISVLFCRRCHGCSPMRSRRKRTPAHFRRPRTKQRGLHGAPPTSWRKRKLQPATGASCTHIATRREARGRARGPAGAVRGSSRRRARRRYLTLFAIVLDPCSMRRPTQPVISRATAKPPPRCRISSTASRCWKRSATALEHLAFETERGDPATLAEVGRRPRSPRWPQSAGRCSPARAQARRAPFRAPVGRAHLRRTFAAREREVTFRIARPDDLWFHARGDSGLARRAAAPSGSEPRDADDLDAAADLAARTAGRGRAGRVEIDYHRAQARAQTARRLPGLVWYTHARTRVGNPRDASSPEL